jgi:hypothetical protein
MSLVLKADPIWDSREAKDAVVEEAPLELPVNAGLVVDAALGLDIGPDDEPLEPPSKRLVTWS